MRQCWAVGFSILEISKYTMQRFFYKDIIPKLGPGGVSIIMSDTDSFLLEVKGWTEDMILDRLRHVMDLSNLDPAHPLHDTSRSKVPGYLKNEIPLALILEAVALKSKTYALRTNRDFLRRVNGVIESVKNRIPFEEYKKCIKFIAQLEVEQNTLRAKQHINQMLKTRKIAFSSFDDKRYLLCAIHSVPYGSVLANEDTCYFCRNKSALY